MKRTTGLLIGLLLSTVGALVGAAERPSLGPSPREGRAASTAAGQTVGSPTALPRGATAYATTFSPTRDHGTFDLDIPGTITSIATHGRSIYAGDFHNGDLATYYAIDSTSNELLSMVTGTGAITVLSTLSPVGGQTITGLAGDTGSGVLFAVSTACDTSATLYTVDFGTLSLTTVGTITNVTCPIALAADGNGNLFAADIVSDSLIAVDAATAAGTVVGALGIDISYAQGMDFDEAAGVLYLAAYTTQGELYTVDTGTGAASLVGAFQGGVEVDGLAVATVVPVELMHFSVE